MEGSKLFKKIISLLSAVSIVMSLSINPLAFGDIEDIFGGQDQQLELETQDQDDLDLEFSVQLDSGEYEIENRGAGATSKLIMRNLANSYEDIVVDGENIISNGITYAYSKINIYGPNNSTTIFKTLEGPEANVVLSPQTTPAATGIAKQYVTVEYTQNTPFADNAYYYVELVGEAGQKSAKEAVRANPVGLTNASMAKSKTTVTNNINGNNDTVVVGGLLKDSTVDMTYTNSTPADQTVTKAAADLVADGNPVAGVQYYKATFSVSQLVSYTAVRIEPVPTTSPAPITGVPVPTTLPANVGVNNVVGKISIKVTEKGLNPSVPYEVNVMGEPVTDPFVIADETDIDKNIGVSGSATKLTFKTYTTATNPLNGFKDSGKFKVGDIITARAYTPGTGGAAATVAATETATVTAAMLTTGTEETPVGEEPVLLTPLEISINRADGQYITITKKTTGKLESKEYEVVGTSTKSRPPALAAGDVVLTNLVTDLDSKTLPTIQLKKNATTLKSGDILKFYQGASNTLVIEATVPTISGWTDNTTKTFVLSGTGTSYALVDVSEEDDVDSIANTYTGVPFGGNNDGTDAGVDAGSFKVTRTVESTESFTTTFSFTKPSVTADNALDITKIEPVFGGTSGSYNVAGFRVKSDVDPGDMLVISTGNGDNFAANILSCSSVKYMGGTAEFTLTTAAAAGDFYFKYRKAGKMTMEGIGTMRVDVPTVQSTFGITTQLDLNTTEIPDGVPGAVEFVQRPGEASDLVKVTFLPTVAGSLRVYKDNATGTAKELIGYEDVLLKEDQQTVEVEIPHDKLDSKVHTKIYVGYKGTGQAESALESFVAHKNPDVLAPEATNAYNANNTALTADDKFYKTNVSDGVTEIYYASKIPVNKTSAGVAYVGSGTPTTPLDADMVSIAKTSDNKISLNVKVQSEDVILNILKKGADPTDYAEKYGEITAGDIVQSNTGSTEVDGEIISSIVTTNSIFESGTGYAAGDKVKYILSRPGAKNSKVMEILIPAEAGKVQIERSDIKIINNTEGDDYIVIQGLKPGYTAEAKLVGTSTASKGSVTNSGNAPVDKLITLAGGFGVKDGESYRIDVTSTINLTPASFTFTAAQMAVSVTEMPKKSGGTPYNFADAPSVNGDISTVDGAIDTINKRDDAFQVQDTVYIRPNIIPEGWKFTVKLNGTALKPKVSNDELLRTAYGSITATGGEGDPDLATLQANWKAGWKNAPTSATAQVVAAKDTAYYFTGIFLPDNYTTSPLTIELIDTGKGTAVEPKDMVASKTLKSFPVAYTPISPATQLTNGSGAGAVGIELKHPSTAVITIPATVITGTYGSIDFDNWIRILIVDENNIILASRKVTVAPSDPVKVTFENSPVPGKMVRLLVETVAAPASTTGGIGLTVPQKSNTYKDAAAYDSAASGMTVNYAVTNESTQDATVTVTGIPEGTWFRLYLATEKTGAQGQTPAVYEYDTGSVDVKNLQGSGAVASRTFNIKDSSIVAGKDGTFAYSLTVIDEAGNALEEEGFKVVKTYNKMGTTDTAGITITVKNLYSDLDATKDVDVITFSGLVANTTVTVWEVDASGNKDTSKSETKTTESGGTLTFKYTLPTEANTAMTTIPVSGKNEFVYQILEHGKLATAEIGWKATAPTNYEEVSATPDAPSATVAITAVSLLATPATTPVPVSKMEIDPAIFTASATKLSIANEDDVVIRFYSAAPSYAAGSSFSSSAFLEVDKSDFLKANETNVYEKKTFIESGFSNGFTFNTLIGGTIYMTIQDTTAAAPKWESLPVAVTYTPAPDSDNIAASITELTMADLTGDSAHTLGTDVLEYLHKPVKDELHINLGRIASGSELAAGDKIIVSHKFASTGTKVEEYAKVTVTATHVAAKKIVMTFDTMAEGNEIGVSVIRAGKNKSTEVTETVPSIGKSDAPNLTTNTVTVVNNANKAVETADSTGGTVVIADSTITVANVPAYTRVIVSKVKATEMVSLGSESSIADESIQGQSKYTEIGWADQGNTAGPVTITISKDLATGTTFALNSEGVNLTKQASETEIDAKDALAIQFIERASINNSIIELKPVSEYSTLIAYDAVKTTESVIGSSFKGFLTTNAYEADYGDDPIYLVLDASSFGTNYEHLTNGATIEVVKPDTADVELQTITIGKTTTEVTTAKALENAGVIVAAASAAAGSDQEKVAALAATAVAINSGALDVDGDDLIIKLNATAFTDFVKNTITGASAANVAVKVALNGTIGVPSTKFTAALDHENKTAGAADVTVTLTNKVNGPHELVDENGVVQTEVVGEVTQDKTTTVPDEAHVKITGTTETVAGDTMVYIYNTAAAADDEKLLGVGTIPADSTAQNSEVKFNLTRDLPDTGTIEVVLKSKNKLSVTATTVAPTIAAPAATTAAVLYVEGSAEDGGVVLYKTAGTNNILLIKHLGDGGTTADTRNFTADDRGKLLVTIEMGSHKREVYFNDIMWTRFGYFYLAESIFGEDSEEEPIKIDGTQDVTVTITETGLSPSTKTTILTANPVL